MKTTLRIKNKDNLNNEDDLKNKNNLKNEDKLEKGDNLKIVKNLIALSHTAATIIFTLTREIHGT